MSKCGDVKIMSLLIIENISKNKKVRYAIILSVFVFISNLNAIVDSFLHPQIPYFDSEHLIVGGITGFISLLLLSILGFYIHHLELITQEARISKDHKQTLFEMSPIGLVLSKITGEIVEVNATFARILGKTKEEILQYNFWDMTSTGKDKNDGQLHKSIFTARYYGPREIDCLHKDGHMVPARLQGLLLEENDKEYIWSSIEDITDLKESEYALKQKNQELEQANENIEQLTGLIPMCANCKSIRDDKGYWNKIESYIQKRSDAQFTGGMCKDCRDQLYGSKAWYQKARKKAGNSLQNNHTSECQTKS